MSLPKQEKKIGNCGNAIAENGRKKRKNWNGIMAMALPKQVKIFFGNYGNVIAENGRKKKLWLPEFKKKKCYVHNIFTTFSQQITGNQLLLVQI